MHSTLSLNELAALDNFDSSSIRFVWKVLNNKKE